MFWAGVIVGVLLMLVILFLYEVWDRWRYERDWEPDLDRFEDERGLL